MELYTSLLSWNQHGWGGPGWHGGFWWPWMLIPLLLWGGFIALVAWAVVRLFPRRGPGSGPAARDRAEEILRERFARGELSEEEYLRALEILRNR